MRFPFIVQQPVDRAGFFEQVFEAPQQQANAQNVEQLAGFLPKLEPHQCLVEDHIQHEPKERKGQCAQRCAQQSTAPEAVFAQQGYDCQDAAGQRQQGECAIFIPFVERKTCVGIGESVDADGVGMRRNGGHERDEAEYGCDDKGNPTDAPTTR